MLEIHALRLQLNVLKIELQWFGSRAEPVTILRDLSVYLDTELTMKQHSRQVISGCFFQLRRLRQICRSAGEEVTKRLITALVLSRLDYCNAALAGLPESIIRPLQRVQNAAALLITKTKPSEHITPVLMHLHWLLIKSRIKYKLCFQMHLTHTNQRPD
jgi:hypothetical protein